MLISIAQINSTIGDFDGNAKKIITATEKALAQKARLVLFPELSICGYPPMDLLDQDIFTRLNIRALRTLQQTIPKGIAVGVGYVNRNPSLSGKSLVNAYGIIENGTLAFQQAKTLLPTYDVFDETRNFQSADSWQSFAIEDESGSEKIGIAICEDVWRETETPGTKYCEDPIRRLLDAGITFLAVPSASPYYTRKHKTRIEIASSISFNGNIPIAYINAVGANDSIIFDGRSFFMETSGNCINAAPFVEDLITFDTKGGAPTSKNTENQKSVANSPLLPPASKSSTLPPTSKTSPKSNFSARSAVFSASPTSLSGNTPLSDAELDVLQGALVMGIRDYMEKCGFKRAHLGLSGGIDSALVAYLGVQAIGGENVVSISMPSRFSSQGSKDDAADLALNLGCRYETVPIEPVFASFLSSLEGVFEGRPFDIAEENLQARIRGTLLMGFSNKWNSMQLTTGNKSELAMGYCTLYGDMNGALGPIGDLFKSEVFALCRRINEKSIATSGKAIIPPTIIEKPPSAELRPDQKDQDSLPPYDLLDEILSLYLFENLCADEIAQKGYDRGLCAHIIKTVVRAEFKRRQAPPVLKVSPRAFGIGRRMPIARSVYEI
ncbi:MAG: NAD+ synthase [Termitinemataceae bacterium]|nr:MAG: NAD+ synthase [Termitinemataceae bacterium]